MKIMITIQHPAHVHFFKNVIDELEREGVEVDVVARKKDISIELLNEYNIDHQIISNEFRDGLLKIVDQAKYECKIFKYAREFSPDIILSIGEPASAHTSCLQKSKSYIFTDTDNAKITNMITFPFADRVYVPDCYPDTNFAETVRHPSYHELSYLHPNRFDPNPDVLDDLGFDMDDDFILLRQVSWDATHDIGDSGFTDVSQVINYFEELGYLVIISSEIEESGYPDRYNVNINPTDIHDVMYYANLFIGESATMATESAVLGTPGIFVSSSSRCYIDELEEIYGIVHHFSEKDRQYEAISKAKELLEIDNSHWKKVQESIIKDKIDMTDYVVSDVLEVIE